MSGGRHWQVSSVSGTLGEAECSPQQACSEDWGVGAGVLAQQHGHQGSRVIARATQSRLTRKRGETRLTPGHSLSRGARPSGLRRTLRGAGREVRIRRARKTVSGLPLLRVSLWWVVLSVTLLPWWPCCCAGHAPAPPSLAAVSGCCEDSAAAANSGGAATTSADAELNCHCRPPDVGLAWLADWAGPECSLLPPAPWPCLPVARRAPALGWSTGWGLPPPASPPSPAAPRAPPLCV